MKQSGKLKVPNRQKDGLLKELLTLKTTQHDIDLD